MAIITPKDLLNKNIENEIEILVVKLFNSSSSYYERNKIVKRLIKLFEDVRISISKVRKFGGFSVRYRNNQIYEIKLDNKRTSVLILNKRNNIKLMYVERG